MQVGALVVQLGQCAGKLLVVIQNHFLGIVQTKQEKLLLTKAVDCVMLLPLQIQGLLVVEEADEILKHAVLRAVLVDELSFLVLLHIEIFHDGAHDELQH